MSTVIHIRGPRNIVVAAAKHLRESDPSLESGTPVELPREDSHAFEFDGLVIVEIAISLATGIAANAVYDMLKAFLCKRDLPASSIEVLTEAPPGQTPKSPAAKKSG